MLKIWSDSGVGRAVVMFDQSHSATPLQVVDVAKQSFPKVRKDKRLMIQSRPSQNVQQGLTEHVHPIQ